MLFRSISHAEAESALARDRARIDDEKTSALQNERIALANQRLSRVRSLFENGTASSIEVAAAERDLAIADARGDVRKIATAKVSYTEKRVELVREQFKLSTVSEEGLNAAETALNEAKTELLNATHSQSNDLESPQPPRAQ